jgi:predicted aspartyl protease
MMQFQLVDSLPFVTLQVAYLGQSISISNVLLDTGSASTILSADSLEPLSIYPAEDDVLHTIRGVGGTEVVYLRQVDFLQLGDKRLPNFAIEVGGMDYGFTINGILGMDFLLQAGAVIHLATRQITFS